MSSLCGDSSVRRGTLRAIIAYSDAHPDLPILRDNPAVTYEGFRSWARAGAQGATIPSNTPVREALRLVGGGAWALATEAEKYARVVGGRGNLLRVLGMYAAITPGRYKPPPCDVSAVANELFGLDSLGKISLLTQNEVDQKYSMNPETSCGFFYQRFFPQAGKKLGYIVRHSRELSCVAMFMRHHILPAERQPMLPWQFASRGKMVKLSEVPEKMAQGKALTRAVSVGEPSEHYLFFPLYKPVFRRITQLVTASKVSAIIQIGVRKNSRDWPGLWRRFSRYDYILTTDWSGFDTSISPELLRLAWDILVKALDLRREEDRTLITNLTNLYEMNFVGGIMHHAGYTLAKEGGIPSGSILTSIVGSIVNYIVLKTLLSDFSNIDGFDIAVYGDDAIVGLNTQDDLANRQIKRAFLHRLAESASARFGMLLSKEKTELSPVLKAQFHLVQPHFSEPEAVLRRGTRGLQEDGARPCSPWNFMVDYKNGYTHRARYDAKNAVHFLGKGFDVLGRPIMSTFDTYVRLVNPETAVNTVADAKERVLDYACDNVHNKLLINNLCYVYIALTVMGETMVTPSQTWPRELAQRFANTAFDDMMIDQDKLGPHIRRMANGQFALDFRCADGYVDLYRDEYYGKIIREYESKLTLRTGWGDVQCDWERARHYAQRRTPTWSGLVIPKSTPDLGGAPAPTSESRYVPIHTAAHSADLNERYLGQRTKLGRGTPGCNEVEALTWEIQARGNLNAGFITGLLLGVWAGSEAFGRRVREDVVRILPYVRRDRPYADMVTIAGDIRRVEACMLFHWEQSDCPRDVIEWVRAPDGVGPIFQDLDDNGKLPDPMVDLGAERVRRVLESSRPWDTFYVSAARRELLVLIWRYLYAVARRIIAHANGEEAARILRFIRDRGPGTRTTPHVYIAPRRGGENYMRTLLAFERSQLLYDYFVTECLFEALVSTRSRPNKRKHHERALSGARQNGKGKRRCIGESKCACR